MMMSDMKHCYYYYDPGSATIGREMMGRALGRRGTRLGVGGLGHGFNQDWRLLLIHVSICLKVGIMLCTDFSANGWGERGGGDL